MQKILMSTAAAFLVFGATLATFDEANAVVCARGVYRAGCAGARGAAVVHRPVVAPRRVVVAPRRVW